MNNKIANEVAAPETVKTLFAQASVKKRFSEILGQKSAAFISSVLSVVNQNKLLSNANPQSILHAAATAASLDLPINSNLGFAYIIPYKTKTGEVLAQFQMGYKGFIQLAMRTGQYKLINVTEVYEGEIKEENKFTGEYVFGSKTSDKVIGYMAFFRLVNGFEKYSFMAIDKVKAHAQKYSQTMRLGYGLWIDNFDEMAKKTVLKLLLSRYGILSLEMRTAIENDQSFAGDDKYMDNPMITTTLKEPEAITHNTEETQDTEHPEPTNKPMPATEVKEYSGIIARSFNNNKLSVKYTFEDNPETYFTVFRNDKEIIDTMNHFLEEKKSVKIQYTETQKEKDGVIYTFRRITSAEELL